MLTDSDEDNEKQKLKLHVIGTNDHSSEVKQTHSENKVQKWEEIKNIRHKVKKIEENHNV